MASPFYVSPEQQTHDKAEFARKGIARGKPIVALDYDHGIVMIAENRSGSLRKLGEIYDRIGFAGVGKFDEYENLRKQGVRYADVRGYSYSRDDVIASNLATEYSQLLGQTFSQPYTKPLEVELLICEVGSDTNEYFQVLFDGSVRDRQNFAPIGGDTEKLEGVLKQGWKAGLGLGEAVTLGRKALTQASNGSGKLDHESLEIVLLDRRREGRKFRRLRPADIQALEEFGELRT
jgi:proteasome alpha subunit